MGSSEYDTTYYNSYLKSLYEPSSSGNGNTNNAVYHVDTFLFNLANTTSATPNKIESQTISANTFKKLNNITFKSENLEQADIRASEISTKSDDDYNSTTTIPETTDPNIIKLKNSANKEYVRLTLNQSSTEFVDLTALKQSITDNIHSNTLDTKSNTKMNEYMRDIFTGTSKYFFKNGVIYIRSIANDQSTYYLQAIYYLGTLSNSKFNLLFDDIQNTTKITLYKIVKAKIAEYINFNKTNKDPKTQKKITENFIVNLLNFNGPVYYKLRNDTIKAFTVKSQYFNIAENQAVISYFKMIAIDLYIKTSYNLIVYDYISCLTETYIEYGDFINSRLGLLAKVIYTNYFVNKINTTYKPSQSSENIQDIVTIVSNLQEYLSNINSKAKAADLHIDLHNKSNQVVDKNQTVQSLSKQIRQNQLAMRNVIYNTATLRKQYKYKMIELIVLILTLIIIITVSCVLLFLDTETNGFKNYVLYISGITVLIILILELAKIISNIVKKSH